ncbi:hypothetical protein E2K93_16725 [Thalassotalea sp. HSM 43]|uniref:hypothetical protein n=1 Tax=Thalassotalea sp. HSM 43 TaxID=2552945 RepID=UPI0010803132|nr:hypothetical protein [Thalassotalea sp. HSM 43]QBY05905.1 hypothetical protein E2K93_16725 [Thalassotalea sp. HSM 43]
MKVLNILLTALFCIFAALGLASIILGKLSPYALVIVVLYLGTAAALNNKGGKLALVLCYICVGLFIACGLLALTMFMSTFFGHEYDAISPVVFALFGIIGVLTLVLVRQKV